MNTNRFQYIENWTEADLLSELPSAETDIYEYKSSLTKDDDLGNKISEAASAFWNSGGGVFIAGIDPINGKIDGGISEKVGRQGRRDWVDQHVSKTEPPSKYWVNLISRNSSTSPIQANRVVLVIGFEESFAAPHMAHNKKYYLRAGVHSAPASHFLVEAIRARRIVQSPILRAILRRSEHKSRVVELSVIVLNDSAALNVQISFDPLPKVLGESYSDRFPLIIPIIDRLHPFSMELYAWGLRSELFGKEPVTIKISYDDLLGNSSLKYEQTIDVTNSINPMSIGETDSEQIEKAIKEVSKKIELLTKTIKK